MHSLVIEGKKPRRMNKALSIHPERMQSGDVEPELTENRWHLSQENGWETGAGLVWTECCTQGLIYTEDAVRY